MINKYRLKLKNNRIVGPFSVKQIGELYQKGHLEGDEECQLFPVGDWQRIGDFDEISSYVAQIITGDDSVVHDESAEGGTVVKLSLDHAERKKAKEEKQEGFSEFKFSKEGTLKDYIIEDEDLEGHSEGETDEAVVAEEGGHKKSEGQEKEEKKKEEEEKAQRLEVPTRVVKGNQAVEQDFDRTTVRPNQIPFPEAEKKAPEEKKEDEEGTEEVEEMKSEIIDVSEKTQFVNLDKELSLIKSEAATSEDEFEKDEREIESQLKEEDEKRKSESNKKKKDKEKKREKKQTINRKKKMKPIVAIILLVAAYFLFFQESEEEGIVPIRPIISFPVTAEYEDLEASKKLFDDAIKQYRGETYEKKILAAQSFKKSLEKKYNNNKSLGWLIKTYAELYPCSQDKSKAAKAIFRLIQVSRSKILQDANVVQGAAQFYYHLKKYKTATNTIENYKRVNQWSMDLLIEYLNILLESGDLTKAKSVYEKIGSLNKLSPDAYIYMSRFLKFDEKHEEANNIIMEGLKQHPDSVPLLLAHADYLINKTDLKNLILILGKIKELKAEKSPLYYSKYLEYMGLRSVLEKNNKTAVLYFKEALKFSESDSLRSKLAALELGGSQQVEGLILESKMVSLLARSKDFAKDKKWEDAFRLAIEASDLSASYIPAQLWLAELQIKRGFFKAALETLTKLQKEHSLHVEINYNLINAYIEAEMLLDAQKQIAATSHTLFAKTPEYAALLGRYYRKKNNVILAVKWLTTAINMDPINDDNYYLLAKTFLSHRKYQKGKMMLGKAIALDPENLDYQVLYASILYEMQSVDAAIGYLRNILNQQPENPQVLGAIAIYYYRSGQSREFENFRKKIMSLATSDPAFYEFMIETAKLEDKSADVIKYAQELIRVRPGDINTTMLLGDYMVKNGNLQEALSIFEGIKSRLESFPKVNYNLAKVYLKQENYEKALEMAKEEIKYNDTLEFGHFIAGEIYKRMGNFAEAVKMLEKAISINGKSIESLLSLAEIKFKQNYLDISRELYNRILREDPSNAEATKQLGFVFKQIGQSQLAIESFKTYLKLSPEAPDRDEIEERIRQMQ